MGMSNEALEQALKQAVTRLTNALATRPAPNSLKLEGKTLAEVSALILAGTAANADKFSGRTYEEMLEELTGNDSLLAIIQNNFNNFVERRDNPHQVNKAQVGLELVENFGVATSEEAIAGVASDKYMTPVLTKEVVAAAIEALVGTAPEALDTLQELAAALQSNGDVIDQLMAQIASKETPEGAQLKATAALEAAKVYSDNGIQAIVDFSNDLATQVEAGGPIV